MGRELVQEASCLICILSSDDVVILDISFVALERSITSALVDSQTKAKQRAPRAFEKLAAWYADLADMPSVS